MKKLALILTLTGTFVVAARVDAQGRGRSADKIPAGYRPPPGMCRIWIDEVPPGRQPAPTDCAAAVRNLPANGRVIFGDDLPGREKGKEKGKVEKRKDDGDNKQRKDRNRNRDGDGDGDRKRDRDRDRGRGGDDDNDRDGDRNDDRRSDRRQEGRVSCDDRDGRRCDVAGSRQYPSRLPEMSGAVLIQQGIVTPDAQAWLGVDAFRASYVDADGDGRPETATWFDRAGQIVQVWTDSNRDGRADTVQVYENGRLVTTRR